MPNKAIYIQDAAVPTWARAEELAGGSLSGLLSRLISDYVSRQEGIRNGMERIEING